ncbi:hypothetical protein KC318_g13928 [Hortaea werneckii]|nr:hypothetical protein KC334_g14192 [Hortaea werneckii]KAI6951906.1 hypothetical protein KC355_g14114 [Hortaea werneckii]KAI7653915.1 hypothetical protein KC318_g13928 [Hortaea werneckii]
MLIPRFSSQQLIELWETYLYQLDTDEDGPPPVAVAGVQAPPNQEGGKSDAQLRQEALESEGALEGADASQAARLSGTTARESEEVGSRSNAEEEDSPRDDADERQHTAEA